MKLEDIEKFEQQSITLIIFNMIKWFMFEQVEMKTSDRPEVESGVWMTIRISKGTSTWYVEGQRLDIVQRRLAEWLKNHLERERNKQP